MKAWLARNKDNELMLFTKEPFFKVNGAWFDDEWNRGVPVNQKRPEVKWDNQYPTEIEIAIK
jgi:hypothetical protein